MKFLAITLICLTVFNCCQANLTTTESPPDIINGEIAPNGFAPWQVSVQNEHGQHISGGAIIAEKYILTAASSVAALNKSSVKVITGTNNWTQPAAQYNVKEIFIHPNHDRPNYHNDVALIKLTKSIVYDANTQSIDLADLVDLNEGEILTMTGWGKANLEDSYPQNLRKLELPYINNEDCIRDLGEKGRHVDLGHLCVQPENESGACYGDAGSPLINSDHKLVGIGNWNAGCGVGGPDVYARISFYSDWIRTTMAGCWLKNVKFP